jgi:hypothetical protein
MCVRYVHSCVYGYIYIYVFSRVCVCVCRGVLIDDQPEKPHNPDDGNHDDGKGFDGDGVD